MHDITDHVPSSRHVTLPSGMYPALHVYFRSVPTVVGAVFASKSGDAFVTDGGAGHTERKYVILIN